MSQNRNTDLNPGRDSSSAHSDKSDAATGAGAAMKSETATRIDDSTTQNVLSDEGAASTAAMTADEAKASPPGAFAPFRYYVNNKLRNGPDVMIKHGGGNWKLEELTVDGQLRLSRPPGADDSEDAKDTAFSLVPLDERYIPSIFEQIL